MRPLPPVAARRSGVFTSREAAASGWSRSALENAARHGRLEKLQRGVWSDAVDLAALSPARAADLLLVRQAVAAAVSTRGGIVGHLAAARLDELPIWAPSPRPCITLTDRARARLDHVHTHRSAVPHGRLLHDVVFTTTARTILDITREFGVEAGLVTADAALHQALLHVADLRDAVARARPAPGGRRLTELLALLDPRAESPLESRSRWQLHVHGVTPPRSQVVLRHRAGRVLGRVDFFWDEGVVGEVDGNVKYDELDRDVRSPRDDARSREKWRQELLERTGLLVVRWGQRDFQEFDAVTALIADRRARVRRPDWPRDWIADPSY